MSLRIFFLMGCCAASAVALAQNATLGTSIGVMVFPAAGQDATQQSIDEATCYNWATENTGSDPFQLTQQAAEQAASADRAMRQAEQAGQGAGARSAATGAVTGALVGSVFGNSSRDRRRAATAGAVIGGASGSSRRSQQQSQATQSVASQSAAQQANIEQRMTTFKNAFGACMEANEYVARS
jgi:uncharacterized protein YcfJ